MVWPSNCLKIHAVSVCFLLTELSWLSTMGFLKEGGGLQLLIWGPFDVQVALHQVTPVRHPSSDTLLQPASSWVGPLSPRSMFARLKKRRETPGPYSGI